MDSLEHLIKKYVDFKSSNSGGWEQCVHQGCDHGRKGPRAGFKFDGDVVGFHCFNCGTSSAYDPSKQKNIPKKLRQVLEDFGIPKDQYKEVEFNNAKALEKSGKSFFKQEKSSPSPYHIEPIHIPDCFYLLENDQTAWGDVAREYLKTEKNLSHEQLPYLICHSNGDRLYKKWDKRLIIPYMYGDDIVFYKGRDLTFENPAKYISATGNIKKLVFNHDAIRSSYGDPLYVTEGEFDALHVNGVAIVGNEISKEQEVVLQATNRKKVYIPDRHGDGSRIAKYVVEYLGWDLAIPYDNSWSSDVKDVSDIAAKYGRLFLMSQLAANTFSGSKAIINLSIRCK